MERNEILAKLTPIFRTAFNDETIELDEDMTTDDFDNWDSVTQMIIVSMIEKEFSFYLLNGNFIYKFFFKPNFSYMLLMATREAIA